VGGVLPAFGRPTGLIVNYTPVRAVVFDLAAKPVAELDAAYRPGTASLSICGRALADHDLGVLFGGR
jgi:hypothetical protein